MDTVTTSTSAQADAELLVLNRTAGCPWPLDEQLKPVANTLTDLTDLLHRLGVEVTTKTYNLNSVAADSMEGMAADAADFSAQTRAQNKVPMIELIIEPATAHATTIFSDAISVGLLSHTVQQFWTALDHALEDPDKYPGQKFSVIVKVLILEVARSGIEQLFLDEVRSAIPKNIGALSVQSSAEYDSSVVLASDSAAPSPLQPLERSETSTSLHLAGC